MWSLLLKKLLISEVEHYEAEYAYVENVPQRRFSIGNGFDSSFFSTVVGLIQKFICAVPYLNSFIYEDLHQWSHLMT